MSQPTFLDLDALEPAVQVTVKLGGAVHELKPVTLEDFVANIDLLQQVGMSGDLKTEMEIMKKILLRAFPTITEAMLVALRMDQLKALSDFAMEASGHKQGEQDVVAEAKEKGEENPR